MSTAIEKQEPRALATVRVQAMRVALDEESAIRAMVKEFVARHMVKGTDYGRIPGTDKDVLFKPGAQKLISLFRCAPTYKLVTSVDDFDSNLFSYTFRVRLVSRDTKEILAEGYGSANSREGRYRWRDAQRKCPSCGKPSVFKSKNPGEGFYCWKKKDGCGATFAENDPVALQPQGKVENDDVATLANTILKMAKKRAEVDGAIALAHCADMFTQDLEDLAPDDAPVVEGERVAPRQQSPAVVVEKQRQTRTAKVKESLATRPVQQSLPSTGHVLNSDEEEIVTPLQALWRLGLKHGKPPKDITAFALATVGKAGGFTHEDVALVELALKGVKP